MTEKSLLLFGMKPKSWISEQTWYICGVFSSHPWTLIVQCLAVCFDVPVRIERAPVFPHDWMSFSFILLMEAFLKKADVLHASVQDEKWLCWRRMLHRLQKECMSTHTHTRTHTHRQKMSFFLQKNLSDNGQKLRERKSILWLYTDKQRAILVRAEHNRPPGWTALISIDEGYSGATRGFKREGA